MKDSHRRALRAALRLTTMGTLVGCGSAERHACPRPEPVVAVQPQGALTVEVPTPAATLPVPTPAPTLERRAPSPLDGCAEVFAREIPEDRDMPSLSPAAKQCCAAAAQAASSPERSAAPWPRFACCSALDWTGSAACSPWGPAMPQPAVAEVGPRRRRPLDLREAARAEALRLPHAGALERAAIATWTARMVNEHGSARVFEQLAEQLSVSGELEGAAHCLEFAREERRHGVLCGAVVNALGGEAVALGLAEAELPPHEDASTPREAALRNVLSVACLHETVAVALIGAEREEMQGGELRELLTGILADEVGHARFGWRLLTKAAAELSAEERGGLERYLRIAFLHLEEHELEHLPANGAGFASDAAARELGLCDGLEARELFYATVHEVIIRGLSKLGLDAERAWQERGAARTRRPF